MDIGKPVADIISALGKDSNSAIGTFIGFGITATAFWIAGKERLERLKLDIKREETQIEQLKQKEDRIDRLHVEIERLIREKNPKQK